MERVDDDELLMLIKKGIVVLNLYMVEVIARRMNRRPQDKSRHPRCIGNHRSSPRISETPWLNDNLHLLIFS
jgi:hypothetical protein